MSDRIDLQHKQAEKELREDRDALRQHEQRRAKIQRRREELLKIIRTQKEFTEQFDQQIAPFERRYSELTHSVDGIHRDAKAKYEAAVKLLVDKLGYHPAFKRHNDLI